MGYLVIVTNRTLTPLEARGVLIDSKLGQPRWFVAGRLRTWRNGRRAGFRCQCPQGRGGSNPLVRTAVGRCPRLRAPSSGDVAAAGSRCGLRGYDRGMESHVETVIDGPIARVFLNRPDKLNGITFTMLDGLMDAATQIDANRDVRAVVLEGRGPSFCAGLDFGAVMTDKKRVMKYFVPNAQRGTNRFQEPIWAWRRLHVPVIAVTRGHVFGGGIQLALAADFRYTTPDCQWSVLEAKWGLVPDMAGTIPLLEQLPLDVAKRLAMTGETFSGTRAAEWGVASGVADDPSVLAEELIEKILERSPDSVAASKELMSRNRWSSVRSSLSRERSLQRKMFGSPNTKIARQAGMAKTKPEFGPRTFG